jgi:cobalamin biosynthesis protein CbiG
MPDDAAGSFVVGVGMSSIAEAVEVDALVRGALAEAGIDVGAVAAVATVEGRLEHPAVRALPWPARGYAVDTLAAVAVPNPSDRVAAASGTASVAEAAALLAAGDGAELIVPKRRSEHATVAVARSAVDNPGGTP